MDELDPNGSLIKIEKKKHFFLRGCEKLSFCKICEFEWSPIYTPPPPPPKKNV
jgi:hypothetical protein